MAYTNYRRIYEKAYGPIPKDSYGRSCQIHHIDGDRSNNSLDNLKCVSIQEHYDIHYLQGDYSACARLAADMQKSPEEISKLNKLAAKKRVQNGTHNFLGGEIVKSKVANGTHHLLKRKDGTSIASELVKNKKHHLLKREDGTSISKDRVNKGTHNFLGKKGPHHPRHNPTVYTFMHKTTGEIINMTMYQFRTTYNVSHSNLSAMIKGRVKSLAGFILDVTSTLQGDK
jgi:hypothetical protein